MFLSKHLIKLRYLVISVATTDFAHLYQSCGTVKYSYLNSVTSHTNDECLRIKINLYCQESWMYCHLYSNFKVLRKHVWIHGIFFGSSTFLLKNRWQHRHLIIFFDNQTMKRAKLMKSPWLKESNIFINLQLKCYCILDILFICLLCL